MTKWFKPVLYVVLIALTIWTLSGFVKNLKSSRTPVENRTTEQETGESRVQHDRGAQGRMVGNLLGVIGCGIALGLLISRDVNRMVAEKAEEMLFNDDVQRANNPDYEHAEKVWANGQYLEAIGALRDFLNRNPREIYAAIRIAEIYEADLQNHLAAALEYEEVLKHKFSADRWGWAAIHLVNIYSGKLEKHDEAVGWLKRIAAEVPKSNPAKKARERLRALGMDAPEPPDPQSQNSPIPEPAAPEEPAPAPKPEPPSNLPKGFRPKT